MVGGHGSQPEWCPPTTPPILSFKTMLCISHVLARKYRGPPPWMQPEDLSLATNQAGFSLAGTYRFQRKTMHTKNGKATLPKTGLVVFSVSFDRRTVPRVSHRMSQLSFLIRFQSLLSTWVSLLSTGVSHPEIPQQPMDCHPVNSGETFPGTCHPEIPPQEPDSGHDAAGDLRALEALRGGLHRGHGAEPGGGGKKQHAKKRGRNRGKQRKRKSPPPPFFLGGGSAPEGVVSPCVSPLLWVCFVFSRGMCLVFDV